ncbi:MAG: outer membrane lipoprotein-sorting protein [bacterium]
MQSAHRSWASAITRLATRQTGWMLLAVVVATVVAGVLSEKLQMRLNFVDLLPEHNKVAQQFRHVQELYPEPSIVMVIQGERDDITKAADSLSAIVSGVDGIYNVDNQIPVDWIIDHGFVLMKPKDFDRMLRVFSDPSLIGTLRGFNDDYEREYTDSEDNLRRDELQVARSLQGVQRSLEVLEANLKGTPGAAPVSEAARAMLVGEPYQLSLDRKMAMVLIYPDVISFKDTDKALAIFRTVQEAVAPFQSAHPEVKVEFTGIGPIGQAEMSSIGTYTYVLTLIALILIYLLIARSFHGWVLPMLGTIPLIVGIIWTMGTLQLVFGTLNMMTVMMGLVLLGLGIDFTIHMLARYSEERSQGADLETTLDRTIGDTGTGVLTGALTTAAAFFALMIADTKGIFEFGFAAGIGVLITLMAIFIALPPLLVLHEKFVLRRGHELHFPTQARTGFPIIGKIASGSWHHRFPVLIVFFILAGLSLWATTHTRFEYDWMKLEPQKEPSVQLQRIIPDRFGTSDQAGWVISPTVEAARETKEKLRNLPAIGDVIAISDLIPAPGRVDQYAPRLAVFRSSLEAKKPTAWKEDDATQLATEISRLWDNLDLMSNIAFQSGLDRVVRVIDEMTGYRSETNSTDPDALLPRLSAMLEAGGDPDRSSATARDWEAAMKQMLIRMTKGGDATVADLPGTTRKSFLPRGGEVNGPYMTMVIPRKYAWTKEAVDRFIDQTSPVAPDLVSNPLLFIVMIRETLLDGRNGSILAFFVILILLLIHFRGPMGLLATVPLIGSALMMLGVMHLLGMKYNYVNLIAVPIILGIGIDDGVHALHRWRKENTLGAQRVNDAYRHVGRAILLTSLTTMIGFGSIGLYEMPAMSSFGTVLFLGVGFCFIASVIVLPAVMRVLLREHKKGDSSMDTTKSATTVGILLLALALTSGTAKAQGANEGQEWLKKLDDAERVDHSYGTFSQTITTSTGAQRTLKAKSWSAENGDLQLMVYIAPARVAGDKILQRDGGDNIWYYMKRRDVTRHFVGTARRQSAMGSDFSYEDMAQGDMTKDYTAETLGQETLDGVECIKLKCTPTESGPSYNHIIIWAGLEDHLTRKIDYYDESGLLKTLTISNFQMIDGRKMGMSMVMKNQREGSQTVIEQHEVSLKTVPDLQLFTKSVLTQEIQ